ncbi:MAG TPA: penicillin-binding protein 2 [Nitrospirae bacterium]|nr:stage V sporulation protein D [bacterium BMS3Abin06]HDH12453.1 penicillin-binding protein 2 [Nitrospirota bacterium]HDZ02410.1 penicillin-binding protein 2 [Nitrospirota bacterium]
MAGRKKQKPEIRKLWDEDPKEIPFKKSRKRAVVLNTIIFFGFAVILLRLVDLMILSHEKLSERAEQQYIREKVLEPQRGVIWDRQMREMATNVEADSLYGVPSKMKDTRNLSRDLAPLVHVSSKQLNMRLLKKKRKDFIWIDRKMDMETARDIRMLLDKLGYGALGLVPESRRFYPKGRTASHILGFTDIDNKGIAGIELMYNEYLKGEVRNVSIGTDARGNRLSSDIKDAVSGNNLLLTIDEGIQYIVERELSNAMTEWKSKAAVAVMMDPGTGEILAMANMPAYNPNHAGKSRDYARRNRAITDLYEPGSTLKTVLAAAALEEEVVELDEEFDVSKGYIVVGGKAIRDVHPHEVITFQEVIQKSSNVGAVQIGLKLGEEKYYSYLRSFGFGEKTGIDFPGEVRGILRQIKDWSGTSLAALSIGQEIGVTPLQLLRAYAAIANDGVLMKPYIVSDIISPQGDVVKRVAPKRERRVVSVDTAETVRDILKMVVEEGGTAQRAYIRGNLVAGKTGTAQIFDPETGRYSRDKYVSSFVGFVPADNPRIALIVVVYEAEGSAYGGVVAAPVFKKIIEDTFAYLDIPMERDENRIILVSKPR